MTGYSELSCVTLGAAASAGAGSLIMAFMPVAPIRTPALALTLAAAARATALASKPATGLLHALVEVSKAIGELDTLAFIHPPGKGDEPVRLVVRRLAGFLHTFIDELVNRLRVEGTIVDRRSNQLHPVSTFPHLDSMAFAGQLSDVTSIGLSEAMRSEAQLLAEKIGSILSDSQE